VDDGMKRLTESILRHWKQRWAIMSGRVVTKRKLLNDARLIERHVSPVMKHAMLSTLKEINDMVNEEYYFI
jgi:hypothetical protein